MTQKSHKPKHGEIFNKLQRHDLQKKTKITTTPTPTTTKNTYICMTLNDFVRGVYHVCLNVRFAYDSNCCQEPPALMCVFLFHLVSLNLKFAGFSILFWIFKNHVIHCFVNFNLWFLNRNKKKRFLQTEIALLSQLWKYVSGIIILRKFIWSLRNIRAKERTYYLGQNNEQCTKWLKRNNTV